MDNNTGDRTTTGAGGDGGDTAGGGSGFEAEIIPLAISVLKRLETSGGGCFPVAAAAAVVVVSVTGDFDVVVTGGGRIGWREAVFFLRLSCCPTLHG